MKVVVLPVHHGLNDTVQTSQNEIAWHPDAPPYQWLDALQDYTELKNFPEAHDHHGYIVIISGR